MSYVNPAYLDHAHRELISQRRRATGTTVHDTPADCTCPPRCDVKPPKQSVLDRIADEVLEYGYVLPYTRHKKKAPSLSRWT
jgi:hypothetical protein